MRRFAAAFFALALALGSGCATARRSTPTPPAIGEQEAVRRALERCTQRGFDCTLKEAHLTQNRAWRVHLRVYGPQARGQMRLTFDAFTGALLASHEQVDQRYGPRDSPEYDEGPFRQGARDDD